MNSPKFKVGDAVAVCNTPLTVVIPATSVLSSTWKVPGQRMLNSSGLVWVSKGHWQYDVAGCGYTFAEWCLRPITPDEYLEAPTTQEQSA